MHHHPCERSDCEPLANWNFDDTRSSISVFAILICKQLVVAMKRWEKFEEKDIIFFWKMRLYTIVHANAKKRKRIIFLKIFLILNANLWPIIEKGNCNRHIIHTLVSLISYSSGSRSNVEISFSREMYFRMSKRQYISHLRVFNLMSNLHATLFSVTSDRGSVDQIDNNKK